MVFSATSQPFRFLKRRAHDESDSNPPRSVVGHKLDLFGRPISALAQHHPHELSEIREVSHSSRATLFTRHSSNFVDGATASPKPANACESSDANDAAVTPESADIIALPAKQPSSPQSELGSHAASAFSLPLHEIPKRKSSISILGHNLVGSQEASVHDLRGGRSDTRKTLCTNGRASSPVRHALEKGAQSSEALSKSPSRTFIRTTPPFYLLDKDSPREPRVEMSVRLPSPLFVGGGTVEGQIELKIDTASSKKVMTKLLLISRLSVDIIGVEEVEDGRKRIFLSLATELFDSQHPPPSTLVTSVTPQKGSELFWETRPGSANVPFCINLPLKLGPPPYTSRQANIRYLLCPSAVIKVGDKRSAIRQAWAIQMLTVFDPEKALASLSSPLVATDTLTLTYHPVPQMIKLTAGLHRQTWVSGGTLFIDVHIVNNTERVLKRIELELEKSVLWFSHSVAETGSKVANNLRLPAKVSTEIVAKNTVKKCKEWEGIPIQGAEIRTCELEIPKGHVTIGNGRYFEVRYFVKVTITATRKSSISVQLPVTVIHINSLDIMPNSVAQVAASIEAKRSMTNHIAKDSLSYPPHSYGQAFTAARRQSNNSIKHPTRGSASVDVHSLIYELGQSPKPIRLLKHIAKPESVDENVAVGVPSCHQHVKSHPSCYHCHLLFTEHSTKPPQSSSPKLPRLQVSTSGLGFSESEFEIPPDSPLRKVMLSEKERQMINQQRELRLQRQWSQQKHRGTMLGKPNSVTGPIPTGWHNVAVSTNTGRRRSDDYTHGREAVSRQRSQRLSVGTRPQRSSLPLPKPGRSRSKTNPETMRASFGDKAPNESTIAKPTQGLRSIGQINRNPRPGYDLVENDVFGPNKVVHKPSKCVKD